MIISPNNLIMTAVEISTLLVQLPKNFLNAGNRLSSDFDRLAAWVFSIR
jgi:hypothetical protein